MSKINNDIEKIINDYQNNSLLELSYKYEYSIEGIRKALKRNGIKIRGISEERLRQTGRINLNDFISTIFHGVYQQNGKFFVIIRNKIIEQLDDIRDAAIFYNSYVMENGIKSQLNNIK